MPQVMDKVNSFSDQMLLYYAAPNRSLIVEIMQLDAEGLNQVHPEQRAQYILVLGQYLVMLQHNENMKEIEYKLSRKTYMYHLNKEKFSRTDIQGKTEKARDAWLLLNIPDIDKLHEEMFTAEAEKISIYGMVRAVEGLLNALKKEFSGHRSD